MTASCDPLDFDDLVAAVEAGVHALPQCAIDGTCAPPGPAGAAAEQPLPAPAHTAEPSERTEAESASAAETAPE